MAEDRHDTGAFWVEPDIRGVIPLDGFHVPRRLKRTVRQENFDIRVDTAFEDVMHACAEETEARPQTWINDDILEMYCELHRIGHAHSVEAWQDNRLVGGLYGITLNRAFFGESMFSCVRDASKVSLVHLVGRLIHGGFELLDAQFQNEHLTQFGAIEMPKEAYRRLLETSVHDMERESADFLTKGSPTTGADVLALIEGKNETSG